MLTTNYDSSKPFAKYQAVLRERLFAFVEDLCPLLSNDVIEALKQRAKLLCASETGVSSTPSGQWSLLPFLIALSLDSKLEENYIATVAVAIECFICALDLLDDIEDEDPTPIVKELGTARVLNTSTTLLALSNRILLSLVDIEASLERIFLLLGAVQKALLMATTGQHRDILTEQRAVESFTTEECVSIAEGKAGSLMSLACQIGAMCANANDTILSQFSEMGKLLGIAHQLDNDSHDLYHILQYQQTGEKQGTVKTDLVRQKKTLPVVLAEHALMTLQPDFVTTDEEKQRRFNDALHEGIMTTWGISLLYRERAHDILRQIEVQHPISQELRLLLNFE